MDSGDRRMLGVIGGVGSLATALFFEFVVRMTDASRDQDHIGMVIVNAPWIPDRTLYLLGKSPESPIPPMVEVGRRLVAEGCGTIALPCVTAHAFHRELCEGIGHPILHMVRDTALHLKAAGVASAGIAATDGTLATRLFQQAFEEFGIRPVVPTPASQQVVMSLIYDDVKAGRPPRLDRFREVADELRRGGAEAVVLGCTELSVLKHENDLGPGFIDAMEVLAAESVKACGYPLQGRYRRLLS